MALSKEKLLELAESLGEGETLSGYFDQAELDAKIQARLGKDKPKHAEASAAIAQLEADLAASQREIQEIRDASENKGKSELEKMQTHLAKVQSANKALQAEKEVQVQLTEALETKRQEDFLVRKLQAELLKAGASPKTIEDAVLIAKTRLNDVLKVSADNGDYSLGAINPATLESVALSSTLKDFVEARPNLQTPKPSGGGSETARPGDPPAPTDPTEGMSPQERIAYGRIKEGDVGL